MTGRTRPKALALVLGGVAALAVAIVGLGLLIFSIEGRSDEHATATRAVRRHSAIRMDVGSPVETGWPCWSEGIRDASGRRGLHRFTVTGPRGQGRVVVEVARRGLGGTSDETYELRSIAWTFDGATEMLPLEKR